MPRVTAAQASLRVVASAALGDWVHALAWSPDGREVAAACGDGSVTTVDLDERIRPLHGHDAAATTVAWSATGVLASAGEDGQVLVDGTPHRLGTRWTQQLAWRPDGELLAVAYDRTVHVLDADGRTRAVSPQLPSTVSCIGWHPRGVELAAGTYGGVHLLRGGDGRAVRQLRWKGSVLALAISPDGRRLAHGNQDASVHFWDLRRGTELEMWGYATKVRELAWRHDARLLATGGGESVTTWDFAGRGPAGTKPQELECHTAPVTWLGFQPRSALLASTGQDGNAVLWQPGSDDLPLASLAAGDRITAAAWSPDGRRLALGGAAGALMIADTA